MNERGEYDYFTYILHCSRLTVLLEVKLELEPLVTRDLGIGSDDGQGSTFHCRRVLSAFCSTAYVSSRLLE
jgi:hypothetical protein